MMAVGVPEAADINRAPDLVGQAAESGYKPAQLAYAAFLQSAPFGSGRSRTAEAI